MQAMVWAGVAVTLAGLAGLIWCIQLARAARREGGTDAEVRAKLQRVVLINLGAMGLSALGLALVVFGLMFR